MDGLYDCKCTLAEVVDLPTMTARRRREIYPWRSFGASPLSKFIPMDAVR